MESNNVNEEDNKIKFSVIRLNYILELLITKLLNNKNINRDQPFEWSLMHIFSCSQLSKLLALSRGLNPELAGIAGAIHDLAIIETGIFKNHGPIGAEFVTKLIKEYNSSYGVKHGIITEEELEIITQATIFHSDKRNYSDNDFVELIKDVDSLDRYLHGKETYDFYLDRTNRALKDLNIREI